MDIAGAIREVASATKEIFSWWTSESGRLEYLKRKALAAKRKECQRALYEHRWDDLRRLTDELERMSNQA